MTEIMKGDTPLIENLEKLCKEPILQTADSFGNAYYWFLLAEPDRILDAAKLLKNPGARLAMITAYNEQDRHMRDVCYEFVLEGVVYNLTVHMEPGHDSVPSITPLFANADWHEREMMELYGINVVGHPNPRRLFLDETLDKGLLGEIVPLSIVMNGASSTDLWERILSDKEARQ